MKGNIIGYDPGGNSCHGFAVLHISSGKAKNVDSLTRETAEDVIRDIQNQGKLLAAGIDTLTCLSTGSGGWRPADRWMRKKYKDVRNSIVSPNGLYGSMSLNGQSILISLRQSQPDLLITETHPKVIYWHLAGNKYNYQNASGEMDELLSNLLEIPVSTKTDHEWDAVISAYSAFKSLKKEWSHDLHCEPLAEKERLIWPCGKTNYFWPE